MKHAIFWIMIAACSFLPGLATASDAVELDEHLLFLEPLIGQEWEGGYVGEDAPDIVITLSFEPILAGKAVRYTREAPSVDFFSETHFYWSPNRDEVLFINLNSRGMVGEGVVSLHDGEIVLEGQTHFSGGSMENRTVLHLDAEGVLKDTFTRKKNGEWVHGHFQEFAAIK